MKSTQNGGSQKPNDEKKKLNKLSIKELIKLKGGAKGRPGRWT